MFTLIRSLVRSIIRAVVADPEVQRILSHYPRLFHFLKNRLTPDETFGLHMTIGVVVTAIFGYLFFGLLQDLIGEASIIESDLSVINFVQILRSETLDSVMLFVTYLASWQTIVVGTLLVSIYMLIARCWRYVFAFLLSLAVSDFFVGLIDALFERVRPPLINAVTHAIDFSVPSGQLFAGFVFYGLVGYVLYRLTERYLIKSFVLVGTCLFLGLLAFSRMYLGVAWPADILASLASAAAWLGILITVLEMRRTAVDDDEPELAQSLARLHLAALLMIVLWLGTTTTFYLSHPIRVAYTASEEIVSIGKEDIPEKFFSSVPKYSETLLGTATEPINIVFVAEEEVLRQTLAEAGWLPADPLSVQSLSRALIATIFNQPYLTAPGAPTFWDSRPNDWSYQKTTSAQSVRERHHIHIWKTSYVTGDGRRVWVSTAHFDVGIKFKSKYIVPTHTTDPAIDKEREIIREDLFATGAVTAMDEFQIAEPTLGKNIVGDQFFTDGRSYTFFLE